jgi:hypothetical protein
MTVHKIERAYKKLQFAILEEGAPECTQYPEIFFPEDNANYYSRTITWETAFARKICQQCPVLQLCAEYALLAHEPYGVWGGMTAAERNELLKKRKPTVS